MHAVESALAKNALEPVLVDLSGVSAYTDYLLILSGKSLRQVEAICEGVQQSMKERGHQPLGVEGERGGQWMLIDYGDVVVHIFHHPVREFYDLESLWSDAPRVALQVPAELRVAQYAF
ncbi:MAG: ribosome silencing factor [Deltaproteobacteria bacterium]|nr:ribosome silencing factor [Deltaproteobacteria bacterium]